MMTQNQKLMGLIAITVISTGIGGWNIRDLLVPLVQPLRAIAQTAPEVTPAEVPQDAPATPNRHTITATVTAMNQILVEKDQCITEGQVVSDRVEERQKLEARRTQMMSTLAGLSTSVVTPDPPPEPSHAVERAAIQAAQTQLNYWAAVPLPEYRFVQPDMIAVMDQEIVAERQAIEERRMEAQANLNAATALLQAAQSDYQKALYNHGLLMVQHQQSALERQRQMLDLQTELDTIDTQLSELTVVVSPYGGKVRDVAIASQANRVLTVHVKLIQGGCEE